MKLKLQIASIEIHIPLQYTKCESGNIFQKNILI